VPLKTTYSEASAYALQKTQEQNRKWHLPTSVDVEGLADHCCPGTLTPKTTINSDNPNGLQDFYGALTRLAGAKFAPVAGSGVAALAAANGFATPDRNHIPPVMNGFSNTGTSNIGGYVLIWYHLGTNVAQYGY
jgi:hypothetical protein